MRITSKVDGLQGLIRQFSDLEKKELPFAMSVGINRTANTMMKHVHRSMTRVFDRPTKYTLRSLRMEKSTKRKLEAIVWFKDKSVSGKGNAAADYLMPQVHGGERKQKRFEKQIGRAIGNTSQMYAIPGKDAKLNRYGSQSQGQMIQVLSALKTFDEQGFDANITEGSRKRNKRRASFFMTGESYMGGRSILARGGGKRSKLKSVMYLANRPPRYRKRLPFFEIGDKVMTKHGKANFEKALAEAMKNSRHR